MKVLWHRAASVLESRPSIPKRLDSDRSRDHMTRQANEYGAERRQALSGSFYLMFVGIFIALGNVGFHALVARSMGVDLYGKVSGLLGAAVVATFFASGIQYAIARVAATSSQSSGKILILGRKVISPWILLMILAACFSNWFSHYLRLGNPVAVVLTISYGMLVIVSALPAGVLLGRSQFFGYAVLGVLAVLVRLLFGVIFSIESFGIDGVLWASVLAWCVFDLLLFVYAYRCVPVNRLSETSLPDATGLAFEGIGSSLLSGLLWVLWVMPLVIGRHVLSGTVAGDFGAENLLASGIITLAGPLATAIFPSLARFEGEGLAKVGFVATLMICVVSSVGLVLLGPIVLPVIYGSEFHVRAIDLLLLAVSASAVALWSYALWVLRAAKRSVFGVATVVTIAALVEVSYAVNSGRISLAALSILPAAGLALGSAVNLLRHLSKRRVSDASMSLPQPVAKSFYVSHSDTGADCLPLLASVTVGMMVYNEENSVGACLKAVLDENDKGKGVARVVVVASACTDRSEEIVREIAFTDNRVELLSEPLKKGKTAAVNEFLSRVNTPFCALVNGDTLIQNGALVQMVNALRDSEVGMVGGRVTPLNSGRNLSTRMVNLIWDLHHEVSLRRPKLGEVVVFRHCFDHLDEESGADEVAIEQKVIKAGLQLLYLPGAIVANRGATNLSDYFRHRVRIHSQHLVSQRSAGYVPSTARLSSGLSGIIRILVTQPGRLLLVGCLAAIEVVARMSSRTLLSAGKRHTNWSPIKSAKTDSFTPHIQKHMPTDGIENV